MAFLTVFAAVIGVITVAAVALKIYLKLTTGWCKSKRKLNGKVAIITGANSGIGFFTALDFAQRGATVYLACRDSTRGSKAVCDIIQASENKDVHLLQLDLQSMASVRTFVDEFKQRETVLDILVNNAGIPDASGMKKRRETDEGLEITWATNHLGHFLLTNLLLDLLKSSSQGRVINVSSLIHCHGKIDLAYIESKEAPRTTDSLYADTKLANVLFTRELSRRLAGSTVSTFSLHPGAVTTNIWSKSRLFIVNIFSTLCGCFFKTSKEGAQTTIFCAVDESLDSKSGGYYSDCKLVAESPRARDDEMAARLWELSERLTGLSN